MNQEYAELISMTKQLLLQEHKRSDWIMTDQETLDQMREFAKRAGGTRKAAPKAPSPPPQQRQMPRKAPAPRPKRPTPKPVEEPKPAPKPVVSKSVERQTIAQAAEGSLQDV